MTPVQSPEMSGSMRFPTAIQERRSVIIRLTAREPAAKDVTIAALATPKADDGAKLGASSGIEEPIESVNNDDNPCCVVADVMLERDDESISRNVPSFDVDAEHVR